MLSDPDCSGWAALPRRSRIAPSFFLALALLRSSAALAQTQDWTQTSAPTNNWSAICGSEDLSVLAATVAGGGIYYSTNSGADWYLSDAPSNSWSAITCSTNGLNLIAAANASGIWASSDYGINWHPSNAPSNGWISIACSGNGLTALAAAVQNGVWISSNASSNWTLASIPEPATPTYWSGVASSSDGSILAAGAQGDNYSGAIYISTNSGADWYKSSAPDSDWQHIVSSADGTELLADCDECVGPIYGSRNSGLTWTETGSYRRIWGPLAENPSAAFAAAVDQDFGAIYVSVGAGLDWVSADSPDEAWAGLALSADGNTLVAAASGGGVYVWQPTVPVPLTEPQSQNAPTGSTVEFTASALATSPISYQWQFNGTNLAGATDSSLTLNSLGESEIGSYTVIFSNGFGTSTSMVAVLDLAPIIITAEPGPSEQTVPAGVDVNYSVNALSASPPAYQWSLDGTNLSAQTNSVLILKNVGIAVSGTYGVTITNALTNVSANSVSLTVAPALISSLSADYGISDAILSGSVTTGSNNTVVWFNWGLDTNYSNATPAYPVPDGVVSLNFSNRITGLNAYTTYHYQAVASNAVGVVYGSDQTLSTAPRFVPATGINGVWNWISWSTNGNRLFASSAGNLYLSTDLGGSWAPFGGPQVGQFIASADGQSVVAQNGTNIYVGSNSGATWVSNTAPANFSSFVASGDLKKLAAIGGDNIYVSTNTGATWTLSSAPSEGWISLASSGDGSELFALYPVHDSGVLYESLNSGGSWVYMTGAGAQTYVSSVICSTDGSAIMLIAEGSYISHFGDNLGQVWSV